MGQTPVPTIDAAGITKQPFSAWQTYYRDGFRAIYGSDIYFAPDDRDTQFLDLLAAASDDVCAAIVADFGSRDPAQSVGEGLSSVVKINGIARAVPSFSTVDLLLAGVVGTVIENGIVTDDRGRAWALPAEVVIPRAGQIVATATCAQIGAITAAPGSIKLIATPVVGWQTASNPAAASPGAPIEEDAWLRQRQSESTMVPAVGPIDAIRGALRAIDGVSMLRLYENDREIPDPDYALPPKSIAAVLLGGDSTEIASVLANQKGSCARTYGTTTVMVADTAGAEKPIRFSRPRDVSIGWRVHIKTAEGFTSDHRIALQEALAAWTVALGIGGKIVIPNAQPAAMLYGQPAAAFFRLNSLAVGRDAMLPGSVDIPLAFDEKPDCRAAYVQVILDP